MSKGVPGGRFAVCRQLEPGVEGRLELVAEALLDERGPRFVLVSLLLKPERPQLDVHLGECPEDGHLLGSVGLR